MRNFRLGAYLQTGEEPGLNLGFLGGGEWVTGLWVWVSGREGRTLVQ